jgi:SAM-dependent methyltransferase
MTNLTSIDDRQRLQASEPNLFLSDQPSVRYPCVSKVAHEDGISTDYLIEIFELEKQFHAKMLVTEDPCDRQSQYSALYNEVHRLKRIGRTRETSNDGEALRQTRLALAFRPELEGKSVLDVGCGSGFFLGAVARLFRHGDLCGLDTSTVHLPREIHGIRFVESDIVSFKLDCQFQVIFSHQVLEHIAPSDLPEHLRSIYSALVPGGKFIVCLPNRFWGPQDITRIVDNSFRGKVPAQGSHLNESSYSDLVPYLSTFGFKRVRTLLPLGAFLPCLRRLRVYPWLNQFIEQHVRVRAFVNLVRLGGKPIFKNPIVLICDK